MSRGNRPLSPHLQVYRPQITSSLSILFRIMGVASSIGSIILVWWLVAAASGAEAYDFMSLIVGSVIGQLFLFGWTFALVYHTCNGLRHLYWDTGKGFDVDSVVTSGKLVVGLSIVITIALWLLAYSGGGI